MSATSRSAASLLAARGSLEVARGYHPRRRAALPFGAVLTALVLLATVAALGAGSAVYGAVRGASASDDAARLSSALVASTVRGQDRAGALGTMEGPEGPALVLSSHLPSGDYETRLYLAGGGASCATSRWRARRSPPRRQSRSQKAAPSRFHLTTACSP